MDKRILFLLVAFLLSGVITLFAKVGDKAPSSFILPNKEKTEHLLFKKHIERKIVILNFFASYCLPCKEEIPEIQKLVANHKDVKLIFINIDEEADFAKVEEVIKEWNIEYPVLLDPYQVAISLYAKSKLAVPATFLLDNKGKIRFEAIGFEKDTIEKLEKVLLKITTDEQG
jgi:thiol-disulfide isomerase/thioredoxin